MFRRRLLGPFAPTHVVLAVSALLLSSSALHAQGACLNLFLDPTRVHAVKQTQIYRVWSDIIDTEPGGQNLDNRAAMFVFKGVETPTGSNIWTVYIFGTGYGDMNSDILSYRDGVEAERTAFLDAVDVATVITNSNCMNLGGKTVRVRTFVPHGHLDHINSEFINNLLLQPSATFQIDKIYYHAHEETLVTCNSFCCETVLEPDCLPCRRVSCFDGYGAPYLESWETNPAIDAAQQKIGTTSDSRCVDLVQTNPPTFPITTPPGFLRVQLDSELIHSDGALALIINADPGGIVEGAVFDGAGAGCWRDGGYGGLGYRHYQQHEGNQVACPE